MIEQQLTGIDNLLYFSSTSSSSGQVQITATFAPGTNPDIAQVQVQNKVQQAVPRLPQEVQQQGVIVPEVAVELPADRRALRRRWAATRTSTSPTISRASLQDPISRVPGVGDVQVFGAQYAMRIWLDPYKLAVVQPDAADVRDAIRAQNTQVSAGQIGAQPAPDGQQLNATVTAQTRLQTPEQFRNIILKIAEGGAVVHLGDVARVELGADSYHDQPSERPPGAGMAVQLAPGANALKTVDAGQGQGERTRGVAARRAWSSRSRSTTRPSSGCRSRRWSRR